LLSLGEMTWSADCLIGRPQSFKRGFRLVVFFWRGYSEINDWGIMSNRKLVAVTLVAAGLIVGAGSVAIAQSSLGSSPSAPVLTSESCLHFDASGKQMWSGHSTAKLDALANKVQALVDAHSDVATGAALCSKYDGVAAFVTPKAGALKSELERVSTESSYPVLIVEVSTDLKTLLAAGQALVKQGLPESVTGLSPDTYTGSLMIGVRAGNDQKEVAALVRASLQKAGFSQVAVLTEAGTEAKAA
jgi:hypothetical protein